MNGSFNEWFFIHSFMHSLMESARYLVPMSVFRSPQCPSEPASPHLRSLLQRQCQLVINGRHSPCFHWQLSLPALVWMMDFLNCSTILKGPRGLDNGFIIKCNDFKVVPTLFSHIFLSSLSGSWGMDKARGLPLSGWKAASCLHRQAWGSPSAACTLSLPVPPSTNVLITRAQKAHRMKGQLTSPHLPRPLLSKHFSPLDPSLLRGFTAFYKLDNVALITKVGEIPPKRKISLHFSFL